VECHDLPEGRRGKPLFSDYGFRSLGVGYRQGRFNDVGRAKVTHDDHDVGAFRTPALRNVALTAPYMHDGSQPTLEDVVEFYDEGGRENPNLAREMGPLHLTGHEKEALVAFLRTLTDPRYAGGRAHRASDD
jgi:cytochrome c peroxidase